MAYEFYLPAFDGRNGSHVRQAKSAKTLLIPGFCAGDLSLYPTAWWLRNRGHRVFFAGVWWNTGCPRDTVAQLEAALREIFAPDHQRVVLIGHSLGGIYARELARRYPEMVERIILLGSAIRNPLNNTNPWVLAWYIATRRSHREGGGCVDSLATLCGTHHVDPQGVPQTILYTKRDEVVDWRSCIESGPGIEAIEVHCSHFAMPYEREVLDIMAARLESVPRAPVRRSRWPRLIARKPAWAGAAPAA